MDFQHNQFQTINSKKVLIVNSQPVLTEQVASRLRSQGFWVECSATGQTALQVASSLLPNLVVIGEELPDISPVELAIQIRSALPKTASPMFVMDLGFDGSSETVANESEQERHARTNQMVNRISRLFGPTSSEEEEPARQLKADNLQLDRGRHRAWIDNQPINLTPTEFRLVWELASRPDIVLSRSDLSRFCKGSENSIQTRTVDAHIKSIRRKLTKHSNLIETVHGVGYRFRDTNALPSSRNT